MPRYRLTLEYAGSRYSGWQIQQNARTVQGELQAALIRATGRRRCETYGSGRTDAGVHALAQVAHADLDIDLPGGTLLRRTNDELPHDINLLAAERVAPRFHARHSAVARSYLYQIARRRTAFAKPFVWWIREPLDVALMEAAADRFRTFADFRAFSDVDPGKMSTEVDVQQVAIAEHGALLLIRVVGSHFLWKMVRRMVGVMAAVGRGEIPVNAIAGWLGGDSPAPARLTAPASGLFLERVFYDDPPDPWPIEPALGRWD
jgi:tRNA pseudouridine38-40 synthase